MNIRHVLYLLSRSTFKIDIDKVRLWVTEGYIIHDYYQWIHRTAMMWQNRRKCGKLNCQIVKFIKLC